MLVSYDVEYLLGLETNYWGLNLLIVSIEFQLSVLSCCFTCSKIVSPGDGLHWEKDGGKMNCSIGASFSDLLWFYVACFGFFVWMWRWPSKIRWQTWAMSLNFPPARLILVDNFHLLPWVVSSLELLPCFAPFVAPQYISDILVWFWSSDALSIQCYCGYPMSSFLQLESGLYQISSLTKWNPASLTPTSFE